jgi:hypothetical protein
MDEISALQKHIGAYGKTRDVYAAYRASGYNRKYLAEHEAEILTHKEAKKAFDALGLKKIPSIKGLQQEYAALLAEKKKLYVSYNEAKREMRDILTAKNNVDRLLHYSDAGRGRENERGRRYDGLFRFPAPEGGQADATWLKQPGARERPGCSGIGRQPDKQNGAVSPNGETSGMSPWSAKGIACHSAQDPQYAQKGGVSFNPPTMFIKC